MGDFGFAFEDSDFVAIEVGFVREIGAAAFQVLERAVFEAGGDRAMPSRRALTPGRTRNRHRAVCAPILQ